MAAPTWEPDEVAQAKDEERALLAAYLFSDPANLVHEHDVGLALSAVQRRTMAWLRMITGLGFRVGHADPASTDGENLLLPRAAPAPTQPRFDEALFRVMALVQAGFLELGLLDSRAFLRQIHTDWVLRSAWHLLASRAVLAWYRTRFPGIAPDIAAVVASEKATRLRVNLTEVPREGLPDAFVPLYSGLTLSFELQTPGTVADPARRAVEAVDAAPVGGLKLVLLGQARTLRQEFLRLRLGPPPLPWFLGILRPEWILADLDEDKAYQEEWKLGNKPLRKLREAMERNRGRIPVPEVEKPTGLRARLKARLRGAFETGGDEDLAKMPAYGVLRDEAVEKRKDANRPRPPEKVSPDDYGREHDEWDQAAGAWRIAECYVTTPVGNSGPVSGYERVVEANGGAIKRIRRRFEALRQQERWEGGLADGPELDLDRAIVAYSDLAAGQQPKQDFYKRFVRRREAVCVLTLVDQSGSTQGRVLSAQQESVILFAEGLKTLGVPHAFHGFNGTSPRDIKLWRLKGFDEPYDEDVRRRLGNLRAEGATRLGAVLRHACWMLEQRPEPRRVLLLLSDGKPEDRHGYRGEHGVFDSAVAAQACRRSGVHLHCISMDGRDDAAEYLRPIFGAGRYLQLRSVEELPARLPEVFQGLL